MTRHARYGVWLFALLLLVGCPKTGDRVAVTGVQVTPESVRLVVGEQTTASAVVLPVEVDQAVTWASDAADVAAVDDAGVVTARSSGVATITATSVAGPRHAASVNVTVIDEDEVVISDDARVVDEPSVEVLTSFDALTGTLHFAASTGFLDALEPGHILIADVSDTAPHGFLRMIDEVRSENGEVWIETSQASLEDVILRGSFSISEVLTDDDVEEVELLFAGISVLARDDRGVTGQSDDFGWTYTFDHVLVDLGDADDPARLRVEIDGALGITIEPTFEISFRWLGLDKLTLQLDVDQRAELNLTALGDAAFDRDVVFARKRTTPKTIVIGTLPIVYSYELELFIGANGKIDARVHVGLEQTFDASFGLSYDHKRSPRWDSHGHTNFDFVGPNVTFEASGEAEAYAGGRLAMKFYEAVAPTIGIRVFSDIELTVPGNPVWCVYTGLTLDVGFVVDVPILGRILDYENEVARRRRLVGCAENTPPTISIRADDDRVLLGATTVLRADVHDLEDGAACCDVRWRSSLDGDLGNSTAADPTLRPNLVTEGRHTITATAEDSGGATTSATLQLDVVNVPPEITTVLPTSPQARVRVDLRAYATDPHGTGVGGGPAQVACDRITWSLPGATPPTGVGCLISVVFALPGSHVVTVEATGRHGAVGRVDVTLVVGDAPDNVITVAPIEVTMLPETIDRTPQCNVGWDDYVDSSEPPTFVLSASATDELGRDLRYLWCRWHWIVISGASEAPATTPGDVETSQFIFVCDPFEETIGRGPRVEWVMPEYMWDKTSYPYDFKLIVYDEGDALGENVNVVTTTCSFRLTWLGHVP